jgi:glucokinase
MPQPLSIAIDIGGTNTSFGFISEGGTIIFKNEIPTGVSSDPNELIGRISEIILSEKNKLSNQFEFPGIGIGAPNGNYFNGTIEDAPNLKWKGIIPLAELFSKKLSIPAVLTNDANAGALGELFYGGAKGMKDIIFITLGTGLGSGIISNGELIQGQHGFAGELGHTIVIRHGRNCGCGRKGCLEQYCSSTGIVKTYLEILMGEDRSPVIPEGKILDSEFIFERAMCGDEDAFYAFNYTGDLLGFALANSVAYTDPEAIFLFGGLARAGEILFNPVNLSFQKNLLGIYKDKVKILPSALPENDAALLGASTLVWTRIKKSDV